MATLELPSAAARCIVELRWGPLAGTKVIIRPGETLRVGRGAQAELQLPHDPKVSEAHFELSWDGEVCKLRDLDSEGGTLLGGIPAPEGVVPHGGWIRAGETDFLVYIEGHTPPPGEGDDDEEDDDEDEIAREARASVRASRAARREKASRALSLLREEAARGPLYAVVDAARDDRILVLLRESVEVHRSLYEGVGAERFEAVAPYVVGPMEGGSALLDHLVLEGWGRRWGIYCASAEPPREVLRHFMRLLMVETEGGGERGYFRFFDPEVLGSFTRSCAEAQRDQLLSGVARIWMDDEQGLKAFP